MHAMKLLFFAKTVIAAASIAFGCVSLTATAASRDDNRRDVRLEAHSKAARSDLTEPLRNRGEVRVVVTLQTPDALQQSPDASQHDRKEQRVAARQLRVLE